jgi:hypothetical protein
MSQEPAPAAEGGWKTTSMSLRPTENGGIIVSCSKERERSGKANEMGGGSDYQSKDYAFASVEEALEFARSEFSGPVTSSASPFLASPAV